MLTITIAFLRLQILRYPPLPMAYAFRDTIGRVAAKREPARRLQPLVRMPNVKSGENSQNFLTLLQIVTYVGNRLRLAHAR